MVIDKKLFSRVNKDNKKGKQAEKVQLDKIDAQFAKEAAALKARPGG